MLYKKNSQMTSAEINITLEVVSHNILQNFQGKQGNIL